MLQNHLRLNEKPIIAVCGARGNQGSAVVQALLTSTKFTIRAITRQPHSLEAESLRASGIEVVQADYDHPHTLLKAFEGCYGVFGITNWYESGLHAIEQGKNIVDAAKSCSIKHFIWSSGPDTNGIMTSFTSKAVVARYLESAGMPYTCILVPIYYDSVLICLNKNSTGGFSLNSGFPIDSYMPLADPSDIGIWVASVFSSPEEWIDQTINPCTEWLTNRELAQILSEAIGEECGALPITVEQFLTCPPQNEIHRDEKANMEFILTSHDKQVWSTSLGRRLSPHPRVWKGVCEERLRVNEALMKSPREGPSMAEFSVEVIRDCDE